VRGGPAFAVSLALSAAEPHLRSAAELGAWQVISPASCLGRLELVPDLHGIQEKVCGGAAVAACWRLGGVGWVDGGPGGGLRVCEQVLDAACARRLRSVAGPNRVAAVPRLLSLSAPCPLPPTHTPHHRSTTSPPSCW
jgi:hypothetical protein